MASYILTMHQLDDFVPGEKYTEEASLTCDSQCLDTIRNQSPRAFITILLSKAREQGIY